MIVCYPPEAPPINLPGEFNLPDKKLLVIFNLSPEVTSTHVIVSALQAHPDADAVLLYTAGEASEWNYLNTQHKILSNCYNIKHMALIDSGINAGTEWLTFIPNSMLFRLVDYDQPVVPPEQRTYHYSLLNRIARIHRVKLVLELAQRNLLGFGAVSCGSSDKVYDYARIVPQDKLHLFPIMLDGAANESNPKRDKNGMYAYVSEITAQQLASAVNVVSESSFDDMLGRVECWTRGMYTEKTAKCFLARQFPLFLAVQGYVSYVRHIGFDVFDDIIDHSYDNETDPFKRIQMVADEVQRLTSIPLPELQELLRQNWHRLEHNAKNVSRAADAVDLLAKQTWDHWVNTIRNS